MWLCLNNGFISIVEDWEKPGHLLVRARIRKHLKKFAPGYLIEKTPERDYRFRVSIPRKKVAALINKQVQNIRYNNFKDSVQNPVLHDMYEEWWFDHFNLQRRMNVNKAVKRKYSNVKGAIHTDNHRSGSAGRYEGSPPVYSKRVVVPVRESTTEFRCEDHNVGGDQPAERSSPVRSVHSTDT